ncbi:uncharacterized protein LOC112494747, partial [Cephus cinctus]|uniref:Uncharacterized protein LOC112494747 n=1 Tax=Cephus cinctus TaxID=211228 RepID=A0AAJ7RM70_CEPCN
MFFHCVPGNKRLKGLSASTLRVCGLCEEHFEPSCFIGPKRRLTHDAVPKIFIENEDVWPETSDANVTKEVGELHVTFERDETPVNTATGASISTAATAEFSGTKHVRTYRRVAVNFSESEDENCAWTKIEPPAHSTVPSCEPST